MTLYVDMRAGSKNLPPYLRALNCPVVEGRFNSDVEWLGWTPLGPTAICAEHKSAITGDIFDSMQSGRLTGTQLPMMARYYPWIRYIIVEGNLRRSAKDGTLEIKKWAGGDWEPAYSRNGKGWMYDEFQNRIDSIEEFWSAPHCSGRTMVKRTFDIYETAAFLVGRLNYWSKPYGEHSSARQWDQSVGGLPPVNPMIPTSEVPLVQRWAADLEGIGPKKSVFVARKFRRPIDLALASESDWRDVVCLEQQRRGNQKLVEKRFSKKTIHEFMKQIGTAE